MDFLLKQRLVGAVVLVALAVIFIPMLLEGPDRNLVPEMAPLPEPADVESAQPLERFPQAGEIPEQPEISVVQADAGAATDSESAAQQDADGEPPAVPQEQVAGDAMVAAPDAPLAAPAAQRPVDAPVTDGEQGKPPGPLGNWVVQVGSFSSEQNALRLRDRLRKDNFATQVEKVVVGGKTHFRVRVGPYLERIEAEQAQKKLATGFDLKGRVLSYP